MSMQSFEQTVDAVLPSIMEGYKSWEGDLVELKDGDKDTICYLFLKNMPSWWDDILPPNLLDQHNFLDELYTDSMGEQISCTLRDSIYLTLELFLREQVFDSYARVMEIPTEEPQGWRQGQ